MKNKRIPFVETADVNVASILLLVVVVVVVVVHRRRRKIHSCSEKLRHWLFIQSVTAEVIAIARVTYEDG